MRLREATIADYAAIRDLIHDLDAYQAHHAPELARLPDAPRFTRDELRNLLAHDTRLALVAVEAGVVVGFVEASIREPKRPDEGAHSWCGINNLAVAGPWRRRGIGRRLMEATEDWAWRKGIAQMRLDVFEFNTGVRALYEELGYRTVVRQVGKRL